ncbi:hypothetical protein AHAS_Ahas20G0173600 [Arachis hypogaea]
MPRVWRATPHILSWSSSWCATPGSSSGTPHFAFASLNIGVSYLDAQVERPSENESLMLKWHAQPFGPSTSSLETCTGVPRLDAQVARPLYCGSSKLGVPRLGLQVARPSDYPLWIDELACHASWVKWHAHSV